MSKLETAGEPKTASGLFDLTGRVAVITGGAGLLGQKHAEAIALYGGIPVIVDINEQKAKSVAVAISQAQNVAAEGIGLNITDEDKVKSACEQVLRSFGRVDILVNNAANNSPMKEKNLNRRSRLENFPLEDWNDDLAVGLTGAFLCMKHFGLAIAQRKQGGSIINVSSDLGLIAPDQRLYQNQGVEDDRQNVKPVTYSVVKTGLIGLTRYMATYWHKEKVRCNALCPGGVRNKQNEILMSGLKDRIPLGRMANADEYQGTIVYLASDASSYMTGAVIVCDGGRTVW